MPNEAAAPALRHALQASGLPLDVEVRDGLALLRPSDATHVQLDADARRRVQDLAREHGFTHVALELLPTDGSCDSSSP